MRLFYHNKDYLLSAIVAVTGFNPVTFNAMRRRNGFLGQHEEKGRWARYSLADIWAAQAARELIDKGISTQLAVDMANKLLARLNAWTMKIVLNFMTTPSRFSLEAGPPPLPFR